MASTVHKILEAVEAHDHFVVSGHVDPDPDSVGSVLALAWLLRRKGKTVHIVSNDPIPDFLHFLPRVEEIQIGQFRGQPPYAFVVVDCAPDRTGQERDVIQKASVVINIDHHLSNPGTGDINWIDSNAGAAGQMILELIRASGFSPDESVSKCLLTALVGDTGSFRFSNTSAEVLEQASALVRAGARPAEIAEHLFDTQSWNRLQLIGLALQGMKRSIEGSLAWVVVSRDMLERSGATDDDSEGLVQYPRQIPGVEVAISFREVEVNKTKISFRARGSVDVREMAEHFGGGGHMKAAGCTLELPLKEAKARVLAHVSEILKDKLP